MTGTCDMKLARVRRPHAAWAEAEEVGAWAADREKSNRSAEAKVRKQEATQSSKLALIHQRARRHGEKCGCESRTSKGPTQ